MTWDFLFYTHTHFFKNNLINYIVFLDSGPETNLNPQDLLLFYLQLLVQHRIF